MKHVTGITNVSVVQKGKIVTDAGSSGALSGVIQGNADGLKPATGEQVGRIS